MVEDDPLDLLHGVAAESLEAIELIRRFRLPDADGASDPTLVFIISYNLITILNIK